MVETAAVRTEFDGLHDMQVIRPELNIEKWPIFVPSKSKTKTLMVTKVYQQEIPLSDGRKQIGTVKKVPTAYGDLTTEDLVVYYALIMIWDEEGRSTDRVYLSLRRVARILDRDWGRNVAESIKTSLYRLRMTSFIWSKSFYDATKGTEERWVSLGKHDPFSILEELHIHETKQGGHVTKEACYFKFHTRILENLLKNHTRPVLLNTMLEIHTDIGKLLYRHIDRIMAYKTHYERRSKKLFDDLGLSGKTYVYRSKRKEKLIGPLNELQGVPLTTGTLIQAEIQETEDRQDFKVVFIKQPRKTGELQPPDDDAAEHTSPASPLSPPEELVLYFHRQRNRPDHTPTRKELDQATTLVKQYGMNQTMFIVDYALREAKKTNFDMLFFGAVLQYEQDAIVNYAQQQQRRERRAAKQQATFQEQHDDGKQPAEQLDLLAKLEGPAAQFQAQFDALDPEIQAQLRQTAVAKLASYKNRMRSEAYEETLRLALFREMQARGTNA